MITFYTRFHSKRSRKPAGWKTVKTRKTIADRPGKYEHFTGFISWGDASAAVLDADFILIPWLDRKVVMLVSGQWSGSIPHLKDATREQFDNNDGLAKWFKRF